MHGIGAAVSFPVSVGNSSEKSESSSNGTCEIESRAVALAEIRSEVAESVSDAEHSVDDSMARLVLLALPMTSEAND